jgi:WS/DGAT/MGAT family acyltransferase
MTITNLARFPPSEFVDRWAEFQNSLLDLAVGDTSRLAALANAVRIATPYLTQPAEKMPLNGEPTGRRRLVATDISFKEVREIRKSACGTVNDVVLTALAGALGKYLQAHGESVAGRSVRVLTPVNVRPDGEAGALGNRISMVVVDVPVGMPDPIARLLEINTRTAALKESHAAEGIQVIADALLSSPAPLIAALGKAGASPGVIANLVCTNVPGPMIPLYSVGHRMMAHYPVAPVMWEILMNVAVTSYDGMLYFGFCADSNAAEDADLLRDCLDDAYRELREAAGVGTHAPIEIRRSSAAPAPGVGVAVRTA